MLSSRPTFRCAYHATLVNPRRSDRPRPKSHYHILTTAAMVKDPYYNVSTIKVKPENQVKVRGARPDGEGQR
jgi:hypothetical protein